MVNLVERLGQWTARPVEPQDVLLLQAVRGGPSISVLMTITPGLVMTVSDRIRLQDLVGQVPSRLRRLRHGEPSAVITLNRLADATAGELADLAAVTVPVLRRYLASREQRALYLIEEQTVRPGRPRGDLRCSQ